MEGLKLNLEQSFKTLLACNPSKETIEENHLNERKSLPWLNTRIKSLIRQKQRSYTDTARSTKIYHDWHKFRQLRKTVHRELETVHYPSYVNNLFEFDEWG